MITVRERDDGDRSNGERGFRAGGLRRAVAGEGLAGPSIIAFGLKGAAAAVQFAVTVLIARVLSADGAGLFFLALSIVTVASVLGRLGMDNAILRFVAEGRARGDWSSVNGAFRHAIRLVAATSLLISGVLLTSAGAISTALFQKPELTIVLVTMTLAVVPMSISLVQAEALKGVGWIQTGVVMQSVLAWTVAIILLWPMALTWGPAGAAGALLAGMGVTAVTSQLLWRKATAPGRSATALFDRAKLLRTSTPLLWVSSINVALNWSGSFFLGIWASKADIGVFNAAFRTATLVTMVMLAMNSVVARQFAAANERGDREALRSLLHRSTKIMMIWAAPIALTMALFPEAIMAVFGAEFSYGAGALSILVLAQFFNVAAGSLGKLLVMTGHERVERNVVAISAALNVAINVILIPLWGMIGAAVATAVALVVRNVLSGFAVHRIFGITPFQASR